MTLPVAPPAPIRRPRRAVYVPPTPGQEWDDDPTPAGTTEGASTRRLPRRAPRRRAASRAGYRLTARDEQVLRHLSRYRLADYLVLQAVTGSSYAAMRQVMRRLAAGGLVTMHQGSVLTRGVWLLTSLGAGVIGSDLPVQEGDPSPATLRHSLLLSALGAYYEARGDVVVSEREIRATDTRARGHHPSEARAPQYAVLTAGAGGGLHIPDLVIEGRGPTGGVAHTAVEVELTAKAAGGVAYRSILAAYRQAPHIGLVVYVTPSAAIQRQVLAAADAEGMGQRVQVDVLDEQALAEALAVLAGTRSCEAAGAADPTSSGG